MSKWRARALELFPDMRTESQSAKSVAYFWTDLLVRFHSHDNPKLRTQPDDPPALIRHICLYAIWCIQSESAETQNFGRMYFYDDLPEVAAHFKDPVNKKIIQDLVANIGITEVEKMGGSLRPPDLKKFLAAVRQLKEESQRRSQKR